MPETRPSPDALVAAAHVLHSGGLVAFPTETVYGLGADAANAEAVAKIFTVKGRPPTHPLIVHLSAGDDLDAWAEDVPPAARLLADAFWPGPLTLILRRSERVADTVTGGRATVGLRVPDHPVARELLEVFGGGIAAPSANRFGQVSPTTAADVRTDLGDEVDCILDGGPCAVGVESTILDLTGDRFEILRPGGLGMDRLTEVLGEEPTRWTGAGEARAPGMLASHYAPRARVEVHPAESIAARATELAAAGTVVAVLAPAVIDGLPAEVIELEPAGGPEEYARLLYARMRQADRLGCEVLLAVPPRQRGIGVAVVDRLRRAATRPN